MRNEDPQGPPAPEPPRRDFRFKPAEFEQTNRAADAAPGPAPLDVRQLNRAAGPPTSSAPVNNENEVHAILRANAARAQARGANAVILQPRRPSRRKRDYWMLLVGGNLLIVALVFGLHPNVVTVVFGFSGVIFFSLGLSWVMWVVMDDY